MAGLAHVRTRTGLALLAVILDARSRRVMGRALGRRTDADLAIAALAARGSPPGRVRRGDRGPRHASGPCRTKPAAHGRPRGSMGRRGDPCDDAGAEGLVRNLGHEGARLSGRGTVAGVVARLPRVLEGAHNARRPHPALGHVSPARPGGTNPREAA